MEILVEVFLIAISVVVWALLTSVPLWLLWNWLCPELFGLPAVSFLEVLGLAFLSSLLFKSNSGSSSKR